MPGFRGGCVENYFSQITLISQINSCAICAICEKLLNNGYCLPFTIFPSLITSFRICKSFSISACF
jgi:hypothetical protein